MASTAPDDVARNRQLLLDAAADEFLAHGFAGARLKRIAESAGLTTGAIYGQFRNKEELLLAAIFEDPPSTLDMARESLVGASLGEILLEAAARTGDPSPAQVRGNLLMLEAAAAARHNDAFAEAMRRSMDEQHAIVLAVLEAGVASGDISDDVDLDGFVSSAIAMVMGRAFIEAGAVSRPGEGAWTTAMRALIQSILPG